MNNQFINLKLNLKNLDRYIIRTAILNAIKSNVSNFSGELLDIGCGKMPYKEYILKNSKIEKYTGLDIENALQYDVSIKPDFTWNGQQMPFKDKSYNTVIATEVLEHCPEPEIVLKEAYRVLDEGGIFFFTVPFLWNLHEVPHDEYRYTPFSLERHLRNAGFKETEIKATGGWHASMAQMLGLWVRRSPMKGQMRKLLSKIIKPIMKILIKMDKPEQVKFKEGQMITGLYGTAKK